MPTVPVALTIAGSDSSAGAGLQADLKTFAAFQVYGVCAVTAITAQNTLGVSTIREVDRALVTAQIDAVVADPGVDAVKTGMLATAEIIEAVAGRLSAHRLGQLVVDPVMVAKDGSPLLREDAIGALKRLLLPWALVVTPNAAEAEVLSGGPMHDLKDARAAARAIHALGPRYVVVKGGHFGGDATDLLYDGNDFTELPASRITTTSTHGAGCTYASAICAGLARGLSVPHAVRQAKVYIHEAIAAAFPLGAGHGPLNHFYRWWEKPETAVIE